MKSSPLANKDEFMEEAVALAHSGVVSLLIDAPQARNDWVDAKGGLMEEVKQQSDASEHQVTDLRRGIDLLYGRPDVDRHRIAYVGHSWDAHVGAILAGVETRISAYVLMASGYADEEEAFASKDPERMAQIKQVGADNVHEYFREYAWDDPVYFLGHTDRESIFLQFASADPITKEMAQKYLDRFNTLYHRGHRGTRWTRLPKSPKLPKVTPTKPPLCSSVPSVVKLFSFSAPPW
jgi:pimeloyl-ACP methyl ester carboxylesterase